MNIFWIPVLIMKMSLTDRRIVLIIDERKKKA